MDAAVPPTMIPAAGSAPRAGLAAWLGVLLVTLFCLNVAGGWVRLSGAGVAIPNWPLIELDQGRQTLLPPMDEAGWAAAFATWSGHQTILFAKVQAGEIPATSLGRQPRSAEEFRGIFLTEWLHRLFAAGVGVLALACLGTALMTRRLRQLVGMPIFVAVVLIVVQAVLGAALIDQGTSTRWLFLHQGNAALILGCVLIAILRLLDDDVLRQKSRTSDRVMVWLVGAGMTAAWCELMLGGMLAASRHQAPSAGVLGLDGGPLWWSWAGVATNILDNATLHHIAHRVMAVVAAGLVVTALILAYRRTIAERTRLALSVAASFIAMQAILGIASAVLPGREIVVPLAHLFLGHVLFLVLVLAWRDVRLDSGVTKIVPAGAAS